MHIVVNLQVEKLSVMIPKHVVQEINKLIAYTEEIPLKGGTSFENTSKAFDSYKRLLEQHTNDNSFIRTLADSFQPDFKKVHNQFQNNTIQSLLEIRNLIISNLKCIVEMEGNY